LQSSRPANRVAREAAEEECEASNPPEQFIANIDDTTAHFIKLSARRDGSFVVTNDRSGFTNEYKQRNRSPG
jgi:hypothetical protein